jgi:D-beta-D-heptose 7-phosphate kinase/D-beta-D-heptose 1-phosphate adenosyltransferase
MMHSKELFRSLKKEKIVVVGDIMLDRYLYGDVERISPEAPVPVLNFKKETLTPGGASNVTLNLTGLGACVSLVGVIGADESGRTLLGQLGKNKCLKLGSILTEKSRPTTVKQRIVAGSQQIVRVDTEVRQPLSGRQASQLAEAVEREVRDAVAVIISDYGKGVVTRELIEHILSLRKRKKFIVSVDPKTGHFFYYKGVDLITPNNKEAGEAAGIRITDDVSLRSAASRIVEKLECKNLLITLGPDGMALFNRAHPKGYHIPAEARQVYDVSGAGDTVISVMTAAMAAGATPEKAARIANHAAGIVVSEFGTTAITMEKMKRNP